MGPIARAHTSHAARLGLLRPVELISLQLFRHVNGQQNCVFVLRPFCVWLTGRWQLRSVSVVTSQIIFIVEHRMIPVMIYDAIDGFHYTEMDEHRQIESMAINPHQTFVLTLASIFMVEGNGFLFSLLMCCRSPSSRQTLLATTSNLFRSFYAHLCRRIRLSACAQTIFFHCFRSKCKWHHLLLLLLNGIRGDIFIGKHYH